jgi:hypothetical protein
MTINQSKLSQEVKDKYSIVNNSFRQIAKSNPKDLVTVEIGDTKQTDFFPQVKIGRWGSSENDNEVNLSYRLIDNEKGTPTITTENDKIIWEKGNIKSHFYELPISEEHPEGAYEFEVILKEKPKTNKIEFTLNTKGVDFYYQPPLTEEFKNGYSEEFKKVIVVTETQVKDLQGNVLVNRPENVVGSYAVYALEQKINYVGGKEYKTGQVGFIYRPKITDSIGNWVREELNIDKEKGLLTITIPQDFLDKAVYPISSRGVNFGYETVGGSPAQITLNGFFGYLATSGVAGTGDSISAYVKTYGSSTPYFKGVLVTHSDLSIVTNGVGGGVVVPASAGWTTSTFAVSPTIVASTDYVVGLVVGDGGTDSLNMYYNSGGTSLVHNDSTNSYTTPTNPTDAAHVSFLLSIYATYTAAASGPAKLKTFNGLATAKIKTINSLAIAKVKSINGLL